MHRTITVTEAARNFADCVNRAHYRNTTFVLIKNGTSVARLVPDNEKSCSGGALADVLAESGLTRPEAARWRNDRKAAHKVLRQPVEKWK